MTKFTPQDITEEESERLFYGSLDPRFFLVADFGPKDKYPDIDGTIRLRDGNERNLNRYLHYQLKGVSELQNAKFFCSRSIIDYLVSTNVPTLLIVISTTNQKVYWYFFDEHTRSRLGLTKDNNGRTLDLRNNEISRSNSAELNQTWQQFAREDDFAKLDAALNKVAADFHENVIKCVGLLYLLQKVPKKELASQFNKILHISLSEVGLIIAKLHEEGVVTSTTNLYLLENEQLGMKSLFRLLDDLDLNVLESTFQSKEERATILSQLAKIDHQTINKYLSRLAQDLSRYLTNPTDNDVTYTNLDLLKQYSFRAQKQSLGIIRKVIDCKNPLAATTTLYPGFGPIQGKSQDDLVAKGLEILDRLRYSATGEVFNILIGLSRSQNREINKKTLRSYYSPLQIRRVCTPKDRLSSTESRTR